MKDLLSFINRHCCLKRAVAFTLAEVLVTLGIIGVVSAMTLPTLVKNHQRTVFVTQLQKVYNELSQAAEKALNDNNAVSLAETRYNDNNANAAKNFLNTYFKVVQECTSSMTPCFAKEYTFIDGSIFGNWDIYGGTNDEPCVSLASGASICMLGGITSDERYESGDLAHGKVSLYVDVNGPQGPNIVGRDWFYMELYSDGKITESYNNDRSDSCNDMEDYNNTGYGIGCLSRIIKDGWKMDY